MTAYVRLAKRQDGIVPRWQGSRMPLSSMLGAVVEAALVRTARHPRVAMRWPAAGHPGPDVRPAPPGTPPLVEQFATARLAPVPLPFWAAPSTKGWPPCSPALGTPAAEHLRLRRNDYGLALTARRPRMRWTPSSSAGCLDEADLLSTTCRRR